MRAIKVMVFLSLIVTGYTACKKLYNPAETNANLNYLVVEGIINTGADSTLIKLSRTVKLATLTSMPELKATVTVEDDNNATYVLKEISLGRYGAAPLGLNASRKYRLRIKTADGAIYLSSFESAKITPPIDSVGYKISDRGLDVYFNTHDATNNTRYYRWEYEETWRFHAKFNSIFESDGTQMVARKNSIYYCFAGANSTNILTGSTIKLTQDVISEAPLLSIPPESERLSIRYSILLKQYGLTKEAYDFYENLKKNTESLGSIFDAQPSQLTGNIKCITNAAPLVIGYVSAGTIQTKRIFIDNADLPRNWHTPYDNSCPADTLYYVQPFTVNPFMANPAGKNYVKLYLIPLTSPLNAFREIDSSGVVVGYFASSKECTDCTIRGKVAAPSFWK